MGLYRKCRYESCHAVSGMEIYPIQTGLDHIHTRFSALDTDRRIVSRECREETRISEESETQCIDFSRIFSDTDIDGMIMSLDEEIGIVFLTILDSGDDARRECSEISQITMIVCYCRYGERECEDPRDDILMGFARLTVSREKIFFHIGKIRKMDILWKICLTDPTYTPKVLPRSTL